jgi:hypothetical protein
MPCKPDEEGEFRKWTDFKKNEIDIGCVSRNDFNEALKRKKPSVDKIQLKQF